MNRLSVVPEIANQYRNGNVVTAPAEGNGNGINGNPIRCYNCRGEGHYASNCTVKPRKRDVAYLQHSAVLLKRRSRDPKGTQVECELWLVADAYEENERVKVNCTLEDNCSKHPHLELSLTYAPVYDSDGSTEVSERKGTTKGTRTNTLFTKQSILGKPPSSSYKQKLYSVTPFPKSSVLPKVDKTNALSKPVTSNSAPSTRESKGVQTVKVIASRFFRTNHSKTSRVDNVVPNKPVKSSVRTKSITASQPNVIHRQQANSNSSGFSPTRVNNAAKTISPQPARVHSKSKSSCLSNNFEKLEENHRNSLIPKIQKHKSSKCNNIKLCR
ncbi:reverse transcriptase domain-containing protein [Tanacetum coccineum]